MASEKFGYPREFALTELTCDARLQMRVKGNNPDHVRGMVELLNDPDYRNFDEIKQLPRIRVVAVSKEFFIVDGFQRFEAHEQAAYGRIKAYVKPGKWEDAFLAAAAANQEHKGLMRTPDDKRHAATQMLVLFKDNPVYSDRAIALHLEISAWIVAECRKKLEELGHRKPKPPKHIAPDSQKDKDAPKPSKPKGEPTRNSKPLFDWSFMMEMRKREVQALDNLVKHFPNIFPDGQRSREWLAHNRLLVEMFDSWDDLHKLVLRKLQEKAK